MKQTNTIKEVMKELPESERPYERCAKLGTVALTDAELLAIIMRTGTTGRNSLQLARQILNADPIHKGLSGLGYLSREQLLQIPGIGPVKATQLQSIAELSKRMARQMPEKQLLLGKPVHIAQYFMTELRYATQEYVYAVYLDQKCKYLRKQEITKGTVNASLISPREIFLEAMRCGAVQLVLVHNHPSGNVSPSREDIQITHQVKDAGELLQIRLIDHIIVGPQSYYSFAEHRML